MKPEPLGETLSAYLDGELDAADTARVEQLLRDDRSVRDQLAVLRRTVELVGALPRHRAPGGLAEDLQSRLERSELIRGFSEPTATSRPQRTRLMGILSTAAVLAFVAGGMWFMALDTPDAGPIEGSALGSAKVDPGAPEDGGLVREKTASSRVKKRLGNRAKRNGATELLASATLEQKLAAGMGMASVAGHAFDNESIRLRLTLTDARSGRAITSRLLSHLAKMGAIDAASAPEARSADGARVASLFYRGKAHQNFGEGGGTQILVRASPRQLNELLSEVSRESKALSSVKLSSGPLVVRGLAGVRGALARLAADGEFAGDPLGALASVLGVDRAAPASRKEAETDDLAPSGSRPRLLLEAAARRPGGPGEATSLRASRRSRRSGKRKTNTASASGAAATGVEAESYVTLVIEIAHAPSAPSTPR